MTTFPAVVPAAQLLVINVKMAVPDRVIFAFETSRRWVPGQAGTSHRATVRLPPRRPAEQGQSYSS